ncbi:MAG: SPASM domain-containing protein, partial [Anaeroplasmataceae bacterium]
IKEYTSNIYLHVLGEPLLHEDFINIIDYTHKKVNINLTTNGFLLNSDLINTLTKINRINISLHSTYNLKIEQIQKYLKNIFSIIDSVHNINNDVIFTLRLWVDDNPNISFCKSVIENYIKDKFNLTKLTDRNRLSRKVLLIYDKQFEWPSINNEFVSENGFCLGGTDHISILSNGDVAICCLDTSPSFAIGNIFKNSFDDIINSNNFKLIINSKKNNKFELEICKRCTFYIKEEKHE